MRVELKNKNITLAFRNRALVERVKNRVAECIAKFNAITGANIELENDEPIVFFEKSRTAGYVWPNKYGNRVFLNAPLLETNEEDYMRETIPHEVAHIFQTKLKASDPVHGPFWRGLMRSIGIAPQRLHNYDVSVAVKTFKYVCSCRKFDVSKILHRKMQNGQIRRCKSCRKNLVFLG